MWHWHRKHVGTCGGWFYGKNYCRKINVLKWQSFQCWGSERESDEKMYILYFSLTHQHCLIWNNGQMTDLAGRQTWHDRHPNSVLRQRWPNLIVVNELMQMQTDGQCSINTKSESRENIFKNPVWISCETYKLNCWWVYDKINNNETIIHPV